MLQNLSCEVSLLHTVELVSYVVTLVKLWRVVIFVDDVDLYICCDACLDPMDVWISLSSLKFNKI